MAKRGVQLIILCEDLQQEVFARNFFMNRGFHHREIRIKRSSEGRGSGEHYVRQHYPQEVRTYRSKSTHLSIGLAVVIDADTYSVAQRFGQLDSVLESDAQQKRQPNEKIGIFVPKRNIETWIHYLMGEAVDEEKAYAKFHREGECKPYVEKLAKEICPSGLPNDAPPSLHTACDELKRIL